MGWNNFFVLNLRFWRIGSSKTNAVLELVHIRDLMIKKVKMNYLKEFIYLEIEKYNV